MPSACINIEPVFYNALCTVMHCLCTNISFVFYYEVLLCLNTLWYTGSLMLWALLAVNQLYLIKIRWSLCPCRFGYKGKNQVKLRTNVTFSRKLDLTPFLSSSVQNTSYSSYRLYAVVVSKHTGFFHQHRTGSILVCTSDFEPFGA